MSPEGINDFLANASGSILLKLSLLLERESISEIEDQIEIKDRIAYQEEATEIFTEMPK